MNGNNVLLNPKCLCDEYLTDKVGMLVMAYPCNHIYHEKCSKKMKFCFFCKKRVKFFLDQNILEKYKYKHRTIYQMWIDINSFNFEKKGLSALQNIRFSLRTPYLSYLFYSCYSNPTKKNIVENIDKLFDVFNINLIIENKYLDRNIKKIYVLNHSNYLDSLISFKVLGCGFVASSIIKQTGLMDIIQKISPCLIIDRGISKNTVEQIKDFVDKHNKIFIFPEGMITNQNTLGKFRSGAFVTGHPVQPVVIQYKTKLSNCSNVKNFVLNTFSKEQIDVVVKFLPIIKTKPFNKDFVKNYTRLQMAKEGNFYLSRVTNRIIQD